MPTYPLNPTAASLLGFLHEGPMTGWDLLATAQLRIGGFWSLTQSQVYRELAAMAAAGLIAAGERGRRERQPYTITPAGRAAFAAWVRREPPEETIRFPLLLTIAFGRSVPLDDLGRFVREHREVHAGRLAAYERLHDAARTAGADAYAMATLTFGLTYERAVLAWFASLPEEMLAGSERGDGPAGEATSPA